MIKKTKGENIMASDWNLKRQIAAHHQELGGEHRITMGGKTLSMNRPGVAEELINMLPEKDKDQLAQKVIEQVENYGIPVEKFDSVPDFVKSKLEKEEKPVKPEPVTAAKPVIKEPEPKVTKKKKTTKKKVK